MINFSINNYRYTPIFSTFPGGEEYVKLPRPLPISPAEIIITANLDSSVEVMRLFMLYDALQEYVNLSIDPAPKWSLILNYLPYARQDRYCSRGEAFSLKVFIKLLAQMHFDLIQVADVHSEVGTALLQAHFPNVHNVSQVMGMAGSPKVHNILQSATAIIAPDLGASKKATAVAERYGIKLIQCVKTRNGNKVTIDVLGKLEEDDFAVVVDDICDGGATFLALAKELPKCKGLSLVVTHGLFTKGKEELLKYYDNVVGVYE